MTDTGPISEGEWRELRRHATSTLPDIVGTVGLPSVLLAYQQRAVGLLDSGVSVLAIEKSRRIGLTWALAAACVLRAARERRAGGMDAMYISYSQEMTREFIDACAMWAKAFAFAALAVDELLFDDTDPDRPEDTRQIQAFRIRFASGFEVLALSSAPRTLRGKQGLVIIDEAAFVDALKELLKAALAFLMWGGQVVVCSTHDGAENEFAALVQDVLAGRKPYTHLRIDFDDALRDGLYRRICLVTHREWSPAAEAAWRQEIVDFYGDGADEELFCIPSMGSGAWLPGPLIEARMTAEAPILRLDLPPDFLHRPDLDQRVLLAPFLDALREVLRGLDPDLMHGFGFDFARVSDLSVAWLLAVDRLLRRRTALVVEMRGVPYQEQAMVTEIILRAMPRPLGAAFDATGAGEYVAEAMGRLFGTAALREGDTATGIVAPIKLSQEWYRTNMPPVKAAFEDDAIRIPKDDAVLGDLRLVKVSRGVPQVPPVRTGEKGKRRHGDAAVALALAYFATRMSVETYDYRSARPGGAEERPGRLDPRDDRRDMLMPDRRDGLW